MTSLLLGALAAVGTYLMVTAVAYGRRDLPVVSTTASLGRHTATAARAWMDQAGLGAVRPAELAGTTALVGIVGTIAGAALFGAALPAIGIGACSAATPIATFRARRTRRLAAAHDAWPHLIDEIRVLTGAAGRSIPQALLDVGLRGPEELRHAFVAAHREWLLTTDVERTVAVLKDLLADPTADAACETLLVAHEVGGADLDRRLAELAEDRRLEQLGRRDARAEQAGVRFARRFVVAVPAGMAVAGMSLGDGRAAYATPTGQVLVAVAIALVGACWWWSGTLLRLPEPERVLA